MIPTGVKTLCGVRWIECAMDLIGRTIKKVDGEGQTSHLVGRVESGGFELFEYRLRSYQVIR